MAPAHSHDDSPCRWAALLENRPYDENKLVELPPCEQWSRGKEILHLLKADQASNDGPPTEGCEAATQENVVLCKGTLRELSEVPELQMTIRRTFVELVAPLREARTRAQSDSAADVGRVGSTILHAPEEGRTPVLPGAAVAVAAAAVGDSEAACWPSVWPGNVDDSDASAFAAGVGPYFTSPSWSPQAANDILPCEWLPAPATLADAGQFPVSGAWWTPGLDQEAQVPSYQEDYMSYGGMAAQDWTWTPPEAVTSDAQVRLDTAPRENTTVMLRNLPEEYTRADLFELLEDEGFAGCFDFVYLPVDFSSRRGLGYAIVNFVSPSDAARCWTVFDGYSDWGQGRKACGVSWGEPHQGLQAHLERYRNSPVMHESVPDDWKPALFDDGAQVAFPPPTKVIKAPKMLTRTTVGTRGA